MVNGILNFLQHGSWLISVLSCIGVVVPSVIVVSLAYVLHAIQVLVDMLCPPFNLTSVRQEASILITAYFGSRHEVIAGWVELLVELPCFIGMAWQFYFLALRFFQATLFSPKEAGLLFPFLFVTFHVMLHHYRPRFVLLQNRSALLFESFVSSTPFNLPDGALGCVL